MNIQIIKNIIGHLKTITRHRHEVIKLCAGAGIFWQGMRHDLSKYSPAEFIPGVRGYSGKRSPNENERKEKGYSSAWLHHKGRNRHHFEYWNDYNIIEKKVCPVKMPINYVVEMFCDRVAASKIYQGEKYDDAYPLEYYERGRGQRFIHPETAQLLESFLIMLKEKGEAQTLRHIKALLKQTADLEY